MKAREIFTILAMEIFPPLYDTKKLFFKRCINYRNNKNKYIFINTFICISNVVI